MMAGIKRSAASRRHINISTTSSSNKRRCRPSISSAVPVARSTTTITATTTKAKPRTIAPPSGYAVDPEQLVKRLGADANDCNPVHYLTDDRSSWYILARHWWACPSEAIFQQQWELHPQQRHELKIFGRLVQEKRWSQSWGVSYRYSGATNVARPIAENEMVQDLINAANDIVGSTPLAYNAVLQNWYEPDDTIGKHADDESSNRKDLPIWSLSWGGTRRFVFRAKRNPNERTELYLEDGDLLVMGGTCQQTHHHEVPKRRKTKDPPTARRINFTVRAFLL